MESVYFLREDIDKILSKCEEIGNSNESICFCDGIYVYKIFKPLFISFNLKRKVNSLANLNDMSNYLTIPLKELYINYKFSGYVMLYHGRSLKDLLINDLTNKEKIIKILRDLKNIIKELQEHNMIHGDIQPKNILYNQINDKTMLCDINNLRFKGYKKMYLNNLSKHLYYYYGCSSIIDIQSLNFYTMLLLSINFEQLQSYLVFDANVFMSFNEKNIEDINKGYFDEHVFKEQMDIIFKPIENLRTGKSRTKYLIDYIK